MTIRWFVPVVLLGLAPGSFVLAQEAPEAAEAQEAPAAAESQGLAGKASYGIGYNMGSNLTMQGIKVDTERLIQGLRDGLTKAEPEMTVEEMRAAVQELQQQWQAAQEKQMTELATKNAAEGQEFLSQNKAKESVVVLESGLQYEVLKEGTGPVPAASDSVTVHYRGTLLDGSEFDSSYARNEPATFPVQGVIPGWVEALQLMTVGSKWKLYVPSSLAYGDRGAGGAIGPNATLVFEVELLGIESGEPASTESE